MGMCTLATEEDDDCCACFPTRSSSRDNTYDTYHQNTSRSSIPLPQSVVRPSKLPLRQNDGRTGDGRIGKQQKRWEEMNRREKVDRLFEHADLEIEQRTIELNAEKSREERRRLQWDLDWESQGGATVSADSINADPTAHTAPETPDIGNPKSGHGLAKSLTKP